MVDIRSDCDFDDKWPWELFSNFSAIYTLRSWFYKFNKIGGNLDLWP